MSNAFSLKNIVTTAVVAVLLAVAAMAFSHSDQTARSSWGKVARSSWGKVAHWRN
jgi:Spy/CpxP family protein refolding chaperone